MLKLENISKIFAEGSPDENRALKNINLEIHEEDFVTVIGSNGAGKSTLYNVIAGTMKATSGIVSLKTKNGIKNITEDKEHIRAHYIGRIFQPAFGYRWENVTRRQYGNLQQKRL